MYYYTGCTIKGHFKNNPYIVSLCIHLVLTMIFIHNRDKNPLIIPLASKHREEIYYLSTGCTLKGYLKDDPYIVHIHLVLSIMFIWLMKPFLRTIKMLFLYIILLIKHYLNDLQGICKVQSAKKIFVLLKCRIIFVHFFNIAIVTLHISLLFPE